MKKHKAKDQEQKRTRRLNLNRETILLLNDASLRGLARVGGLGTSSGDGGIFCDTNTCDRTVCQGCHSLML